MVAPVEWVGSVREMIENGVDTFVEIGPGQVLSRLIKRISRDVQAISLNDARGGAARAARGVHGQTVHQAALQPQ